VLILSLFNTYFFIKLKILTVTKLSQLIINIKKILKGCL